MGYRSNIPHKHESKVFRDVIDKIWRERLKGTFTSAVNAHLYLIGLVYYPIQYVSIYVFRWQIEALMSQHYPIFCPLLLSCGVCADSSTNHCFFIRQSDIFPFAIWLFQQSCCTCIYSWLANNCMKLSSVQVIISNPPHTMKGLWLARPRARSVRDLSEGQEGQAMCQKQELTADWSCAPSKKSHLLRGAPGRARWPTRCLSSSGRRCPWRSSGRCTPPAAVRWSSAALGGSPGEWRGRESRVLCGWMLQEGCPPPSVCCP